MKLSGWGRHPVLDCRVLAPRTQADLRAAVLGNPWLIARGAGRSYGDASMNAAATVDMTAFDRFIAFDRTEGVLACETGTMLSDILDVVAPAGWFPPVTPGTRFVTLGGMIAADVHGKNHHKVGSFGQHVLDLDLMVADGSIVHCSRSQNAALFEATMGGMGLTGVILSARFRLIPVETAFMVTKTRRCGSLQALLDAFEEEAATAYSVAWIDCFASGDSQGRGLIFTGRHALPDDLPAALRASPLRAPPRRRLRVPIDLPSGLLNRTSVRALNAAIYRRPRAAAGIVPFDRFFFPLDAIADWNRIYGRRGFVQFQCALPIGDAGRGIGRMLGAVSGQGAGSFLAVLKRLGPGRGPMSFPIDGHTLALDIPAGPAGLALHRRLVDIAVEHGGRMYLAKDAAMHREAFAAGYPDLAAFLGERRASGAEGRFASAQSERLGL